MLGKIIESKTPASLRWRSWAAWALFGLALAGESIALYASAVSANLTITRLSVVAATALLLTGLIPALLRPGPDSRLAAWLALFMAALVALPFDLAAIRPPVEGVWYQTMPMHIVLRTYNGALAASAAYHLTSRFPPRPDRAFSPRRVALVYPLSLFVVTLMFVSPAGPSRALVSLLAAAWFAGLLLAAHRALLRVSRNPDPAYRRSAQQARLLLLGFLAAESPLFLRVFFYFLGLPNIIPYNAVLIMQLAAPLTVAYAILRHDLFEIDATVRRALAYTVVFSLLLAVYFGLTMLISLVAAQTAPKFRGAALLTGLMTAAVAFRPLYRGLQRRVDGWFYPERLHFQEAIAAARRELSQVVNRERVMTLLEKELPRRLNATWARLILAPNQDIPAADAPAPAWNARIVVGDAVLGRYWLGPRHSGLPYDASERAQLQALAEQAGLALAYAETLAELEALNRDLEREVALQTANALAQQRALVATEERQRIARDLHDSVTQTLFSISLGARALRKLALKDPEAAAAGLQEQEQAAQAALAEMRALLAQLRSPLLADGDLAQALRQHCLSITQRTGLRVHLDAPESLLLPSHLANELLHVAREAMHNVLKHSGADEAECRVVRDKEGVRLTVQDRGRGFEWEALGPGRGMGLESMRERVAALGGEIHIESEPGWGVAIHVWVPTPAKQGEEA
ncbi:MAG: sensor histidine kinase [Chloroflexi bacterium]|nr:sensor histidine kinase [Chloroflexota bacterium]